MKALVWCVLYITWANRNKIVFDKANGSIADSFFLNTDEDIRVGDPKSEGARDGSDWVASRSQRG